MLINTKIIAAPPGSQLLFRKALIQRLDSAGEYPLIVLSGPAGSGKTSLAGQWGQQAGRTLAWYALDDEDNEPDLFFRYLLTTLGRADAHLQKAFRPILENQRNLGAENVIPLIITSLSASDRDIHLVLDDFHRITNPDLHDALARLLRYLPARMHLVLLSRHKLIGAIDAVAIKKERLEISAADLKFSAEEAAGLFRDVIALPFTTDQIHELNRYVEGWAAGLQLFGLSVSAKRGPAADFSRVLRQTHEKIADYLIHDILQSQPENIRTFIFATALLDRFNPELCAEVTGMPGAAGILEHLERMNLFLIPLDTDNQWYRYHQMFTDVVRRHAAGLDAAAITAVLRKAALWSARHQHLEDALRSAFRSGDLLFTAELIEDHILAYFNAFEMSAGLRWFARLPESMLRQRPLLRLMQCTFYSAMMEFSDVRETMALLEKDGDPDLSVYPEEKQQFCRELMAYFKCQLELSYADKSATVEQYRTIRERRGPRDPLLAGALDTHIACILILKGDLASAESCLDKVSRISVPKNYQLMKKKVYHSHAWALIARHRLRLHMAEAIIFEVLQFFEQAGYVQMPVAFLLHRNLGNIFYLRNQLDKAREYAAGAMTHCEYFGLVDEILAGNELQLQLHLAAKEYDYANECIGKMHAYAAKLGMPLIATSADACAARVAMAQGNLGAAGRWSRQRNLQIDEPFSLLFAVEGLTQARFLVGRGQYDQALELLVRLRERCLKRGLAEPVLYADILLSATCHGLRQKKRAAAILKQTLAVAETEGCIRPFVNGAKLIAPVLRIIMEESPHLCLMPNLREIFSACQMFPGAPAEVDANETLTQREVEILNWMAQGFQNKEIAQKGGIAITTVKSHVSSILVKLNVRTRTQAILKAREMNMVEMEL